MPPQRSGSFLHHDCTVTPPLTPISNYRCTPPPHELDSVDEAIKQERPKRKRSRSRNIELSFGFRPTTTIDTCTPGALNQVAQPQSETIDPLQLNITPFVGDNTTPFLNKESLDLLDIDWSQPSPPFDTNVLDTTFPDAELPVQQSQSSIPGFNNHVATTQTCIQKALTPNNAVPRPQAQPQPQPQQVLDDYNEVSAMKTAILDLAPALFGQRFKQQEACIFSVVTARDLIHDKIAVALIAFIKHDRSLWCKVARGDQYWVSLQIAMTVLLASLEGMMAQMLASCVHPTKI